MPGGLDLSYLSVYISLSVQLGQFTNKEYEEIMAYSYSTNIKYAVHKCMGRFCILDFTQFSRNRLLMM